MKKIRIIFSALAILAITSCGSSSSNESALINNNIEIDSSYIEYLNNYGFNGNSEIKFITINNINYWVTSAQGAGNRQEYYWMLNKNKLIPMFVF